jgi:uncharacterized protein (DUF885 family)
MMTMPFALFERRDMIKTILSATTLSALPAAVQAAAPGKPVPVTRFSAMLGQFANEILQLSPETATSLGLDFGANLALKSKLGDISPAGEAKWGGQVKSMLSRLATVDRAKLNAADQIRYDTVRYAAQQGVDGLKFPQGGGGSGFFGGAHPYPVTQQDGAITSIPEFLDSQHQIKSAADAEAYLARVAGMARQLDQESARIARDAGSGVMPPSFVAKTALGQLIDYRKTSAATQKLVTSIAERTQKMGIKGNWEARATKMVETLVYPALDRQIAAFTKATASAPDTAGVGRLPDGDAYYAWALRLGTTTTKSPAEIHALGLEQNKAIQARMDTILKAQGMTQGSVGERVQALNKDPRMLYPDTDQGRADLIAYCNDRVAAIRKLLPGMSHLGLKAPLVIKRVPPDIQDGASLGYMNFASLDGSRPAIYYINLKSTSLWPKYQIATLTAHEGVPGHTWQGAYLAEHHKEIPLISSLMGFNAFIEGWALYAEQSCDEAGLYANDPLSQIGYLQAQQFRACRLVVDTGLHAMGWTREQSIRFLTTETGKGENAMTSETDRYCVSPGQACGYKMGHNEILAQRDRAKAALGAKFDLAGFNDAVVKTGGVPLTVLATAIDAYVAGVKG